jgi:hypothetical protein
LLIFGNQLNKMDKRLLKIAVFTILVAIVVLGRIIPHLPNFAPVVAAGMFAAYFFRSRILAVATPLAGLLIGDLFFIGTYDTRMMALVYAALCIPALLGFWVGRPDGKSSFLNRVKTQGSKLVIGAVGASTLFFIVSNLAVFFLSGMYAITLKGLAVCFAAALPFYKFNLAGDLFYTVVIFGGYWLASWALNRRVSTDAVAA